MSAPYERDLAGEATEMDAYRRRLRADISAEEADEEWAEREASGEFDYGDDDDDSVDIDTQRQGWWL